MENVSISAIKAREILDSRGRPMVEVDIWTHQGVMGRSASPCGTSVGKYEASILRDGGKRMGGLGVQQAVKNVTEIIGPTVLGKSVFDQQAIDDLMIQLDGTPHKSRLGANAIYGVSVATARAAASTLGLPLYRYLGGEKALHIPMPVFNMINGGPYSNGVVEFQEFLLIPAAATTYAGAQRMGVEIFYQIGPVLRRRYPQKDIHFGHSAGYAAPVDDPAEVIEILLEAAESAGYKGKVKIGLDCAASHFYDEKEGCYHFRGRKTSSTELIRFLEQLAQSYPLTFIEDPLQEDDFKGFSEITKRLSPILIVGDDLFVNQIERLKQGVSLRAANAMIFKPNMVGTLSEAMDTARYAQEHHYWVIPSSRAGGSVDDPIPDLAIAVGARLAKFGAPQSGERTTYQNHLLRTEEELGSSATFDPLE